MDDALPPGSSGVIAIYDHGEADTVAGALGNSIRSSIAQIDKASAKELKAGLEGSLGRTRGMSESLSEEVGNHERDQDRAPEHRRASGEG